VDARKLGTLLALLRRHGVTEYSDGTLTLRLGEAPKPPRVDTVTPPEAPGEPEPRLSDREQLFLETFGRRLEGV